MLNNRLSLALLLFSVQLFSQVGINTATPNAQLEVKSSNEATPANTDGIIIPKINVFPAVNPTAEQQGMMVYLTTTVGTRVPGFYYWDNTTTSWIGVGSTTANAWGLTGNGGTTAGTNFIGTTDDRDLVFKRNNVVAGKLQINNTSFGLNSLSSNTTGIFNASYGDFSLFSNTTGQQNAGFGGYALWSNTTGSNNAAFGTNAMLSNIAGSSNTALGAASLYGNTTGNFNTAGGFNSLFTNTAGAENTALGANSLYANTSGNYNTGIGSSAMNKNTTGNQNAGFGAYSLYLNTTGSNNAAFGTNAMFSNTAGISNTALGTASLYVNTTGNYNTAGGFNSLSANTIGSNNTAFGQGSLLLNTEGNSNTATGYNALDTNTTGSNNTAVGQQADVSVNNLTNATAIGANALVGASNSLVLGSINTVNGATATVNVGIGTTTPLDRLHVAGNIRMVDGNQAAGKVLTSDANGTATWQAASANAWGLTGNTGTTAGTNFIGTTDNVDLVFKRNNFVAGKLGEVNTALGLYSLYSNTSGFDNVAIGTSSLFSNTSGNYNSAIGNLALYTNNVGSYNTAVGFQSLNASTANYNTAIGASALFNTTTGANNTATGTQALRSNMVGANNTAFGYNSLFDSLGNDNTAVGYEALWTNTTGSKNTALGFRAGVSVNNLTNATAIGSNARVSASNALVLGSINGVNGATSSVNVGMGTSDPQTKLHIVDTNKVTSNNGEGNLHVVTNNVQSIDIGASISLGGFGSSTVTETVFGTVEGRKSNALAGSDSGYLMFKTNNLGTLTERMRITNAGNVGIGITTPGGLFELSLNEGRKPASNTWTITSDSRLKNVNGIYEKGLPELLQLKPIRYNYKNTDKKTFDPKVLAKEAYGFIAQEVQPIFPEAVGTDPDGYLNFDMHPILIASVNALKELDTKNKELQTENQLLKAELEKLKGKVDFILNEMQKR